ncbi:MAG: hypothetical protein K2Q32_03355, partial [Alphaproteobacteria bacterium]|nr:hypothetical protein [Alphaproteobacteria bacterium]
MIKLALFILRVIALVFVAVWVAERAGKISFEWKDNVIETSAALALGGVAFLMWLSYKAAKMIAAIHNTPRLYRMHTHLRQQRMGQKMLSDALGAFSEQKKGKGLKFLRKAEKLLGPSQVVDLVKTHVGEPVVGNIASDRMEATSPYAWKQIIEQHLKDNRYSEALQTATNFSDKHPQLPMAKKLLFDVHVRLKNWDKALQVLELLRLHHAMPRRDWRDTKAALLTERARDALEHNHAAQAFEWALQAERLHPYWVPNILVAARSLAKQDKAKEAANLIERAWQNCPHEQLGDLYLSLRTGRSDLQKAQAAEKMAKHAPANPASRLFVARALTKAGVWGQARSSAKSLADEHPRRDYYDLLAYIEDIQTQDKNAVAKW